MAALTCDVAVIGAGTAGLSAERRARAAGAKTLLIDPHFAGTTCATVGCMPSKLLIAAAAAAGAARKAGIFGVAADLEIDGRAVLERVRAERDRFVASVRDRIGEIPEANRYRGRAAFAGPDRLRLDGGDEVKTRTTVIATGARPLAPDQFRALGDRLLTNETLFDLPDLPGSVAVIGAGPLGLEMAQALAELGVSVALFDRDAQLAGLDVLSLAKPLAERLREAMDLHLGAEVAAEADGEAVRVCWKGESRRFDKVLLAVGRPPALQGLDLEAAGLELDDKGVPVYDRRTLQCGDAPIFIAGDANADRPVLHEASAEGAIAGENAVRYPASSAGRRMTPLAITFSFPGVAQIGRRHGEGLIAAACSWDDQGRARVEGRNRGAACLYADAEGQLVGAELCAPDAEHLAHLLAWTIQCGMTASEALDMPIYHPTLAEGLRPALRELCKRSGVDRAWDREDGKLPGD